MVIIEEYKQKTTFIKRFIPLKAILESARIEEKKGFIIKKSEFAETVEAFKGDLGRQLSSKEIEKLKLLDISVPSYGVILLPPELKYPLVGFNLDNIPPLFEKSVLFGNDEFFRQIYNFAYDETIMALLLKSIEEDDFFTFLLFTNNFYFKPNDIVPVYSTYSQENAPTFLKGTVFHSHLTSYVITSIPREHQAGMFMLVELQKKSGKVSPDIVNYAKKLKPNEIKKLIETTRNEVIKSIEVIVPISRKAKPIKISIRDGVLFLTRTWYYISRNKPILRNLIRAGVPILIGFEADQNNHIREEDIIHVTHDILGARDLPVLESYRNNQGYYIQQDFWHNQRSLV